MDDMLHAAKNTPPPSKTRFYQWQRSFSNFNACFCGTYEVAERALAHTGKTEVLLGGGVACNQRMRDMSSIMCQERGSSSHCPPQNVPHR